MRVTEKGLPAVYLAPALKQLSLIYTRVANFRNFDLHRLPELRLIELNGSRRRRGKIATARGTP